VLRRSSVSQSPRVDRRALIDWYCRSRARTSALFDVLAREEAYYSQPISLRHPLVFYEGHLPAFSFNTLIKKALGGPGIDLAFETLFSRGIDPDQAPAGPSDPERNRGGPG
jgi:iron(II)-dependent oxidoreductase